MKDEGIFIILVKNRQEIGLGARVYSKLDWRDRNKCQHFCLSGISITEMTSFHVTAAFAMHLSLGMNIEQ